MILDNILKNLPRGEKDENLIDGYDSKDDAAVYKINDKISIIETLDFFPAMVEDPYYFGQIAATNALSDVWAMGGRPIMALNIACFPEDVDKSVINKILIGGAEKVNEAGCGIVGGHTIVDDVIKYGLSVTGIVDTEKVLKNNNCRLHDKLILTKPLGIGILTTALKCEVADNNDYNKMIAQMTTLNKYAAEILYKYNVSAMTDVTGFGLFIHLTEMLSEKFSAKLYKDNVLMVTDKVKDYILDDYYTGASNRNERMIKDKIDFGNMEDWQQLLCYDPQTSGGLLCAIDANDAEAALSELNKLSIKSSIVGEIIEKKEKLIYA